MEVRGQHDLKINNQLLVLQYLYLHQSATMLEVVDRTNLSSSSTRNLLRELEKKKIIEAIGNDRSTGGRCPTRFCLSSSLFTVLCIYVHKTSVTYCIMNPNQDLEIKEFVFENEKQLITIIKDMIVASKINALAFAVKGIVEGLKYYTDHENTYQSNEWIENLSKQIHIPVYVENNVRVMQRGIYKQDTSLSDFTFLLIEEIGMGSSIMINGELLKGNKGIVGELGLLPYQGVTLNEAIRKAGNEQDLLKIITYLVMIICTTIDSKQIYIVSTKYKITNVDSMYRELNKYLFKSYQKEIYLLELNETILFNGLYHLTMQQLFIQLLEER